MTDVRSFLRWVFLGTPRDYGPSPVARANAAVTAAAAAE